MNRLLPALISLLLLLPLTACGLSSGSISGRVLEEGTGKPISGAIVVVRWKGYVSAIVDAQTVCVHVENATTDEMGNYKVNGWRKSSTMGPVFDVKPMVSAYKAGHGLPSKPAQNDEDVYLAPFKGTREERLKYLMRMSSATSCPSAGSSSKNLYPMYKAMYEEAKHISVTAEDSRAVGILRQEAAAVAVRPDGHVTSEELERKVNEFLRNNLK